MIVVDASILVAFFLRESGWRSLAKYLTRTISLDMAVKEFYNAVWKAVLVRKSLSVDEASRVIELFRKYLSGNMVLENELDYIDQGFQIALKEGITVYDALYISLALEKNAPLASLDNKQRRVAERLGIQVLPP